MKLFFSQGISNQKDFDGLKYITQRFSENVEYILNSGFTFNDNFRGQIISAAFASANANTQFQHQLNYVPTGYFEIRKSAAMVVYDGSADVFTRSFVTLRSSAVGTATIVVF